MDTKAKILHAALELFSLYGYEGTSVAQIGEAAGIKAPSIYKHYKNKQAVFEAILWEMQERYDEQAVRLGMDEKGGPPAGAAFSEVSPDRLTEMVLQLFRFFLTDPYMVKIRRMMVLEQYRSPRVAALYREMYFDGPLSYQAEVFRGLIASGKLQGSDPDTMAREFYAPIFMLLTLCDHSPERIGEAEDHIRKHILQFSACYGKEAAK